MDSETPIVEYDNADENDIISLPSGQVNVSALSERLAAGSESEAEVALISEGVRPSTTGELVGMLKQAGTELTVKYITGEISFEDFCLELEKVKPKTKQPGKTKQSSSAAAGTSTSNIPAFDQLFEKEEEEEAEDEEDMNDNEEDDVDDAEEEEEDDVDSEFVDAGEMLDKRDEDWMPDEPKGKKEKSSKAQKEKKKESKRGKKSSLSQRKVKPRRPRRKPFDLPKELASSSGRAILLRAQGKTEEAVKLLYDIINKAPKAAAPYQALGSIHEDEGDLEQALKFYMVAANLRGMHATEWMDLVETCVKLNDDKLAQICFSKALKVAKSNTEKVEILLRRSSYYEQQQLILKAIQCKEQMLTYMDKSNPGGVLSVARDIANDYMEYKEESGAISVLQYIHKEFPNEIDSEDVHSLAELLMSQKSYLKSLEIIIRHCGVEVSFNGHIPTGDELQTILEEFANKNVTLDRLVFPSLMPVDLRSKLVQCFVHIKALPTLDIMKDLIKSLAVMDVENYGDIHYDIAETMVECGYHEEARPILQALVHSVRYSKAAVWLTYGQCLNALGDIKTASEAYSQVVEMAPSHYGARVTLSSLLQQMGHNDVALEVLSKGPTGEGEATADQLLLLHKCELLHSQGKLDEFITAGRKLLSFNFPGQCSPEFIRMLLGIRTPKSRRNIVQGVSNKKQNADADASGESAEPKEWKSGEEKKFRASLWDIFNKLCHAMHEKGRTEELLETATLGLTCPIFIHDYSMVKDAEFLCLKMGPLNGNFYHLARNLILEEKDNNQAWNLYCYIVTRLKEVTDLRFALRALMKNPNSTALGMLNGNARLISGTYKQALGEYLAVFRQNPENSMALMCCALCLVHIASQAYATKKNILIVQAVCLLNAYKELRGECQETYYNLGRAMQQLDIQYAAVYYYKKALEFPPILADDQGTFDLSHEIAYNLSRIFLKSKTPELARYYIEKYCVI